MRTSAALALSPDALECLSALALERFQARDFAAAKDALELLFQADALSLPLRFTLAVCLTEVGADEAARQVGDSAMASIRSLPSEDPRRPILEQLAAAMCPWIAGGALARPVRQDLKSSAEKWLPKLGR